MVENQIQIYEEKQQVFYSNSSIWTHHYISTIITVIERQTAETARLKSKQLLPQTNMAFL